MHKPLNAKENLTLMHFLASVRFYRSDPPFCLSARQRKANSSLPVALRRFLHTFCGQQCVQARSHLAKCLN